MMYYGLLVTIIVIATSGGSNIDAVLLFFVFIFDILYAKLNITIIFKFESEAKINLNIYFYEIDSVNNKL